MRSWALFLVLATASAVQATTMSDYRIRGYIEYRGVVGGAAACANSFVAACGQAGRLGLRAAPDSLKVGPPPSGFAILQGKIIDCPEGIATITADAGGNNQQADGKFSADSVSPALIPEMPFVVRPGGNPNSIQIRALGSSGQCIYDFQLMQATSYILGVQPVEWISVFGAAGARAASPVLLLACSLAAAAAVWALR